MLTEDNLTLNRTADIALAMETTAENVAMLQGAGVGEECGKLTTTCCRHSQVQT